jgi:ATP-dependent RNA helicase SUPV3L1/SUV3
MKKKKTKDKKQDFREALKSKLQELIAGEFTKSAESFSLDEQNVVLHVGPTNSGKTYMALQALNDLPTGTKNYYLAPLRLLAWEIADTLNARGVITSLVTGQEKKIIPGSIVTSATIEMFHDSTVCHTVVIDECQMCSEDPFRGGSWTNALLKCKAKNLHICCAPYVVDLITKILTLTGRKFTINNYERLVPLEVSKTPDRLAKVPDNSIIVAFSKNDVLEIKDYFDKQGRPCSCIYGAMPPECRKSQVNHFNSGETKVAVCTDCLGMGVNLQAERVIFSTTEKYDGKRVGPLTPNLARQIAGRAGRYLKYPLGITSAFSSSDLKFIQEALDTKIEQLTHAYYMPSTDELELIPKERLADKLIQWQDLGVIPTEYRNLIKPIDLEERIKLAQQLTPNQEDFFGLKICYLLINTPTTPQIIDYWRDCVHQIYQGKFVSPPETLSSDITSRESLDFAEKIVRKCECFLWLGNRKQFKHCFCTKKMDEVYENKLSISNKIDKALVSMGMSKTRMCVGCGCPLPTGHKHKICDSCYFDGGY